MQVRCAGRTDKGITRETNQDCFGIGYAPPGSQNAELLVVCDGMGGHSAGDVASRMGVETILEYYRTNGGQAAELLESAFNEANRRIISAGRGNMGTTGVAALFEGDQVVVANIGDSRAYLIRNGELRQITRDHSLVGDQLAAGLLTPEEARQSNIRNIITRALGHQHSADTDIFAETVQPGDTILLSTDGMHGLVEDSEIAEVITTLSLEDAIHQLVDLANERGGTDNITVTAARVVKVGENDGHTERNGLGRDILVAPQDAQEAVPVKGERPMAAAPARASVSPTERPLTWPGGLLAALCCVALLGVGAYVLLSPASVNSIGPTISSSPVPTAVLVPTGTPAATAAPTAPAATATPPPAATPTAPANSPTPAPTP
ncbi:MAG: Stp1/IreP family PP2C-type Ser/Thr phosphatase [Chloroflexaceae bacterium]|jgi:protein phosphatase|nr:Stp1/IreP family PP2C-type Ser/Thr phosphatase [Chloroflexaceae bacterium]